MTASKKKSDTGPGQILPALPSRERRRALPGSQSVVTALLVRLCQEEVVKEEEEEVVVEEEVVARLYLQFSIIY